MPRQSRRSVIKLSGALLGGIATGTTVTAAASDDTFIVDTKNLRDGTIADSGLTVVHDLSEIDAVAVSGSESTVESLGAKYAPDTVFELDLPVDAATPAAEDATDDPLFGLQWDKQAQNVPSAQEVTRGEGTRVGIIDTGTSPSHPDLAGKVNEDLSINLTGDGGDFTDAGSHGTHVSGIVAADDENDVGTVGTAPGTELVGIRVFGASGGASFATILTAMVYAGQVGCDVANMSLGAYPIVRQGFGSFYGQMLNRTTTFLNSQGTLLVASAGNDAADLQHDSSVISLPNEAANVMSISATGPIGFGWGDAGLREPPTSPAFYTNFGTNAISVSAPGGDADLSAIGTGVNWFFDLVLSTVPGGWGWIAGTSMSAPQVSGAAALVKSVNPDYSPNQVRETLQRTARDVGDKEFHGAGFLDPNAAVRD